MNVSLMIEDRESWMKLYDRLRELDMLKGVTREDMDLSEDLFPFEFFIDLDPILSMIESPIVKPFKKKIDGTLTKALEEAIL